MLVYSNNIKQEAYKINLEKLIIKMLANPNNSNDENCSDVNPFFVYTSLLKNTFLPLIFS